MYINTNPDVARLFENQKSTLFLDNGAVSAAVHVYNTIVNKLPTVGQTTNQVDETAISTQTVAGAVEKTPITEVGVLGNYIADGQNLKAFFIRQRKSMTPLSISRDLFECLETSCGIFPPFRESILYFGRRKIEIEVAPPRLRFRTVRDNLRAAESDKVAPPCNYETPIARNRGTECCYVLRYIDLNERSVPNATLSQWSLRQSAVYCRTQPGAAVSTWIFVALSRAAEQRLDVCFQQPLDGMLIDPLHVHLTLLETYVAKWRPYLVDLTTQIDLQASRLLASSPSGHSPLPLSECGDRQTLLILEQKLLDSLVAIRGTKDTVQVLQELSSLILGESEKSFHASEAYAELKDLLRELDLLDMRVEVMRSQLRAVTELVSSFLDLSSGHSLQRLATEASLESEQMRILNSKMYDITAKSRNDAVAVKVLTIMTLIYLPATVVSNFFSTQFVNQVSSAEGTRHLAVATDWWIFAAVSVPLTALTLYIWYVWMSIAAHDNYPVWWLGKQRKFSESLPLNYSSASTVKASR